jgi:hypothetical protein
MGLAKNTVKQVVVIGRPPLVTVSVYQGFIDHDPMLGNKQATNWAGSAEGCLQAGAVTNARQSPCRFIK